MSATLSAALGIDREGMKGRFLAVNEIHGSNANFLLTNVMVDCLKRGHGVCLVTLHYTVDHYHHVLAKTSSFNLHELIENRRVETVEILKEFQKHLTCDGNCVHKFWNGQDEFCAREVYLAIKEKVSELRATHTSVSIVLDDVSLFLDCEVSLRDVLSLVQYCRTFLNGDTSLVVCNHVIQDEEDSNILAANLIHVADISVNVSVLKTGHSSDVSGVLEVRNKDTAAASGENWNLLTTYHYKLTDRQIKLYAPGTSMLRT